MWMMLPCWGLTPITKASQAPHLFYMHQSCRISKSPKNASASQTDLFWFWRFLYKGVEKMHLQASEINVKPPLEKFVGDQSNSKLGRGPKHSSWKRGTGVGVLSTRMAGQRKMPSASWEQAPDSSQPLRTASALPAVPFQNAEGPSSRRIFLKQSMTPLYVVWPARAATWSLVLMTSAGVTKEAAGTPFRRMTHLIHPA